MEDNLNVLENCTLLPDRNEFTKKW